MPAKLGLGCWASTPVVRGTNVIQVRTWFQFRGVHGFRVSYIQFLEFSLSQEP